MVRHARQPLAEGAVPDETHRHAGRFDRRLLSWSKRSDRAPKRGDGRRFGGARRSGCFGSASSPTD
ncbi:MAG: hypothetical protein LBS86_00290 [Treponema sp.]|nr:hypothetical protein [Treponema sp.]